MRILAVNQYYPPDLAGSGHLMADLMAKLVERGHSVDVVTGDPSYTDDPARAPDREWLDGVRVYRVPTGRTGRTSMANRLWGYLTFQGNALAMCKRFVKTTEYDRILTYTNPPSIGLVARRLSKMTGTPFVYVVQDIHPDAALAGSSAWIPWPAVWAWRIMNRSVFGSAHRVVVPSEDMRRSLSGRVPASKISVVHNWARPDLGAYRGHRDGGTGVKVLCSGNLGAIHPVAELARVIELCRELPVSFRVIGDGVQRRLLESVVPVEDYQPQAVWADTVAAADVCFVGLKRGIERWSSPARAYTFMSAAKPVLLMMEPQSELGRDVARRFAGWVVNTPRHARDVLECVARDRTSAQDRGRNAAELVDQRYTSEHAADGYEAVLRSLV